MNSAGLTRWFFVGGVLVLGAGVLTTAQMKRRELGAQPDNAVLVPSNQTVKPLGLVRTTEGVRPKDAALSPDGATLAVLTTARVLFFTAATGEPSGSVNLTAGPLGLAWAPDGSAVYASAGAGKIFRLQQEGGKWKSTGDFLAASLAATPGTRRPADPQVTGLAVSPDGKRLFAGLGIRNQVAVLAVPSMEVETTINVGVAPYALAVSPDGKTLVVANRGGRPAREGAEDAAPSAGTPVRVDPKTDAALRGTLTFISTESLKGDTLSLTEIDAGRQPSSLVFTKDSGTLYVANSDEDTVSVVDVATRKTRRSFSVRPVEDPGFGQIPTDLALSADEQTLFVSCGGSNSVAVVDVAKRPEVEGYLPTGWFPIALAERDGRLYIASAKGIGARPANADGKYRVHASVGTVQFVSPEERKDLKALSRTVAANNLWGKEPPARRKVAAVPIPERVGEPSLFKHVVYIIKENHTYDLTLGDIPEGNGDKSLCLFGEEVTPNMHALAREWVLLDNTYTSGTNSADGHQWTDSAVANDYMEHNYSAHSRSYPYDGGDPLAYSPEGFLWTSAVAKGLKVRVYGEFVNKPKVVDPATGKSPGFKALWEDYKAGTNKYQITADTDNAALKPLLHPRFIGFPSTVSDQWRADQYLEELKEFERTGQMPDLSIMLFPNDHTSGTRPGMPTPRAAVADNDLALGRVIEALSKSRFWKETLVLVVEDDSQLGLDHVDGHRTIAFCASPYTRRGAVVSEMYNHTSILRTIELVLGLPAMTRFDRTANSMAACFTATPDLRPFTARPNKIQLDEMNPPARALRGEARELAEACDRLDWSDIDRAHASTVTRAVWQSRRPGQPFPKHAFHMIEDDDDDEEKEAEE